jgi:predicted membrane metal-binding protein
LIYLFDNIIFWLICSGIRVYNIVFLVGLILVHVLAKKKKKDFGSRWWAWVAMGLVAGMGCWSGSVAVGRWLLAEAVK